MKMNIDSVLPSVPAHHIPLSNEAKGSFYGPRESIPGSRFVKQGWVIFKYGLRVRRGNDWAWVLESEPDKVVQFEHLWHTQGGSTGPLCGFDAEESLLVRLPGKPDAIWLKREVDQVDAQPIKAGDRVHFVPCEAIRAHYKLPISAIATVTSNASADYIGSMMTVRLLDGREGPYCAAQNVKSLVRVEDIQ